MKNRKVDTAEVLTQADLARLAGVSQAAVHKALNGGKDVGDALKAKVEQLAAQHGYRLNTSARGLVSGKTRTVSLVISTKPHRSSLHEGLLAGIHEGLEQDHYHLVLARLADEKLTDSRYVGRLLREWASDGLLLNYHAGVPAEFVELVVRYRLPVVWVNARRESDCVYPDDLGAGRLAAEALLRVGHRRIAFIDQFYHRALAGGHLHYSRRDRCEGALGTLRETGIEPQLLMPDSDQAYAGIMPMLLNLLQQPDRPTAIIASDYSCAVAIAQAAERMGLRIPRDLSLVIFADDHSSLAEVECSSLLVPHVAVGRKAAEVMLARLKWPEESVKPHVVPFLPPEMHSIAPPPNSRKRKG